MSIAIPVTGRHDSAALVVRATAIRPASTMRPGLQTSDSPLTTRHSRLTSDYSPTAAVSCSGVTKEFGANRTKRLALRGVDVDVADGQLTLLVGPSGCGKTTLISIIAGLLNPTQGRVAVLGTDLATLSGRQLVEFRAKNIGF